MSCQGSYQRIGRETLFQEVIHTYEVDLIFKGSTVIERRYQERQTHDIIQYLQQFQRDKLTDQVVDTAIQTLCAKDEIHGTFASAKIAKAVGDRSNLGQSAYLYLANAVTGYLDRITKADAFLTWLIQKDDTETLCWWLFGRTPYGENTFKQR